MSYVRGEWVLVEYFENAIPHIESTKIIEVITAGSYQHYVCQAYHRLLCVATVITDSIHNPKGVSRCKLVAALGESETLVDWATSIENRLKEAV